MRSSARDANKDVLPKEVRSSDAQMLRNSLEVMILVFFQNLGKCHRLPVIK